MKILKLAFENLNSLYGKWEIDFQSPEFQAEGLFAITGPTGAGKTTILDAICLALYGRTPRQASISDTQNELMSRGAGHCTAEITFETTEGKFISTWGQHRARKKAEGKLQPASHNVSIPGEEKALCSGIRESGKKIEELVGMNFEQFTKTMLLAQGDFAKLLDSDPGERAEILEQLTGTEIYAEISKAVFEKEKKEKAALQNLQVAMDAIQTLSPEEEERIHLERQQNLEKLVEVNRAMDDIHEILDCISKITSLSAEILKNNKIIDENKLEIKKNRIGNTKAEKQKEQKQNALEELKKEQTHNATLFKQVRALDLLIEEKTKTLKPIKKDAEELRNKISEAKGIITSLKENLKTQNTRLQQSKEWLDEHPTDALLVESLSGLLVKIDEVHRTKGTILQQGKELFQESQSRIPSIHNLEDELTQKQTSLQTELKQLVTKKNRLLDGKLLPEIKNELRHLNEKFVLEQKIASLEEHRNALKNDEPCPLCGSKEHPFVDGHMPNPTETETNIRELEERIEGIETTEQNIQSVSVDVKAMKELAHAFEDWKTKHDSLIQELAPFSLEDSTLEDFEKTRTTLTQRKDTWLRNQKEKTENEQKITESESKKENLEETLSKDEGRLSKIKIDEKALHDKIDQLREERENLFGTSDPNEEEQKIIDQITTEEKSRDEINEKIQTLKNQWTECDTRIKELTRANIEKENLQKELKQKLKEQLAKKSSDFSDENLDGISTHFSVQLEIQKEAQKKNTENEGSFKQQLETHEKNKKKQLSKQKTWDLQHTNWKRWNALHQLIGSADGKKYRTFAQQLTFESLLTYANHELQNLSDRYLLVRPEDLNAKSKTQSAPKEDSPTKEEPSTEKIEEQKKEIEKTNLEIHVVDLFQAGQIRSSKNLSGGESFLVSLALALGLSKMASKNMRIDSLFLDEGFGTLDEQTLHTALEALSNLQQSGKLIGMISHRIELQERIPLKIQVTPISNSGKSKIEGPGCKAL